MKIIVQLEVMIKSAMNPTVEFLIRSLSLDFSLFPPRQCVCVCVCVCCVCVVCVRSSDELMKGNLVRFLITGNYTNTSEMPPSKCTSHVGHIITVISFGLKHTQELIFAHHCAFRLRATCRFATISCIMFEDGSLRIVGILLLPYLTDHHGNKTTFQVEFYL